MRVSRILIIILIMVSISAASFAEELGEVQIKGLLIEPEFTYVEDRQAQMNIDRWSFGFEWLRDERISAYLRLGPQGMNHRPRYFEQDIESTEVTVLEAFGKFNSTYGAIQFGLIKLPFSFESQLDETKRWFPLSLLAKRGYYGRLDFGMSYQNRYSGFHTKWAIHSGESGADLDEQFWLTAQWYFRDSRGFFIGFSGQTGRTKVASTNFSGGRAPITGFEIDEDSRLRASNFFFGWDRPHWKFVFEGSLGEIEQATTDRQWHSLRADVVYQLTQNLDVLLRLDSIDSDNKTADTLETEGSFGFSINSDNKTSRFYILGRRNERKTDPQADHSAIVIWRLTPEISL